MRGDKFAAKRSRAYRGEKKSVGSGAEVMLEGCVRGFMELSGVCVEEDARALLLMAGLGLALAGPDAFEASLQAFHSSHS